MDIEIIKAFLKTGSPIGVIGLILYLIVDSLFAKDVYQFLGSEKVFILILAVLCVLVTAIIFTVNRSSSAANSGPSVTYKDNSTHNGDNRF